MSLPQISDYHHLKKDECSMTRLYVLFKSIPVISGRLERRVRQGSLGVGGGKEGDGGSDRLYVVEAHLRLKIFPLPA